MWYVIVAESLINNVAIKKPKKKKFQGEGEKKRKTLAVIALNILKKINKGASCTTTF